MNPAEAIYYLETLDRPAFRVLPPGVQVSTAPVANPPHRPPRPIEPSIVRIEAAVTVAFGLGPADLRRKTRLARISWPRQVAMFLADKSGHRPGDIDRHFGCALGTVTHAHNHVTAAVEIYPSDARLLTTIVELLADPIEMREQPMPPILPIPPIPTSALP